MADNDNRYKLWQTISKEYDLPDYNQFSKDMEDATKRKSLHDAVSAEYDLPDFDQFSKDMGYETQTSQQGNQNAQNAKKPQQTAQSSHVEEGRGLSSDNGYSKQKTAFDKAAEQTWNKLANKGGIKWTIEGHPEVKMVAVTDDLVKKFPQLEQSRGYQVPFNMSTGTPIMQNIDDKGNIITPDEASEQYTKILTNQDFDYVPKQETASVQIGSVVNTALSTKGGWLDRMARKSMAQYGDDWEHKKFESNGKEVSSSDVFGKVKQTIYDYYNSVLKGIRTHLMFNSDEEKQAYVDNLYKTGQLKEEDIPKANVLHYVQNVDKEEQIEVVRQAKLNRQLELEMAQEKFNQLPQREKGESDFDYNDRILHEGALYEQDIRKLKKQIAQLDAVSDELQGNNTSWKEWGHAFKTSGIGSYHAWDLGATDLKDAIELNKVAKGMKRGMQMTSSDYMALRVMSQANEADAIENAVMPVSYKSKKGGFISAPFTFGFFVGGDIAKGLTSAVNKVAGKVISKAVKGAVLKAGGKKALSAATNLAEKAANTKCVKLFGMLAKDFEKAAFMENTTGAATTGAEILNRHIGTVTESDDGFKMEGESLPTAIIKGEISQNIESQTEFLGEHFPSSLKFIRGMAHTKVGSAMGLRNLAAWLTKVSRTEFATTLKSYATRAGINGVFGEYLEEVAGTAENALLVGDQKFSDLLDVKQQEEVAGSVVLSCLGMGIFGTAIYTGQRGLNMPTYYRLKYLQNKWDNAGLDLFTGEEWAKLKDRIDNTPNEGMKSVMADILKADNMTEEQARAAFNYARCSLTLRGMNLGAMKAAQLGLTDDRHIEQDNAYVEGRQAKDEDKHDIQIEFEDRSHELAEKLGISEQQLDNMSDEDLESLTGKDDQLDNLIYDYQTSHAKYQGVVDNADDEIDKAAQEAARQTDMATDKSRGTVRNATIKATKGEEDYGVYIVSGNVATNEDGSINVSESDDMILYYDPKSGKIEHCDAMRLAALGEEVNAEETRNQAIADAKEKAIRKQAGIIDGTVGEGTSFTITDAEGNEHTYEVLADNGDGSAMITMDGNVQDTPVSLQDLQNLKDAEEAKRLEAAKMQRQQYEEEREKQNAPVEDNLDYADIINTNGNVEIAEVVDEEGNAMFPDAEEVFFVQNQGNRAKVMVLDNEGNLQPKLVKKSSVRTLGTMSVDEYRQERQKTLKEAENASEPSLVDETEPSNNVVPTGNITTDNTTTGETQPGNEAEVTTSDETQKISNEQENTPKITLEDGTEVPMLEDGNPDFSQLTAEQVAELYDSQFGEDAGQIITNNVNRSKKALDKANAMTVSGGSFVEQKASKEAKDKAIAEAKEKYDSAKAIEDAYNERMLAKEEDTPEGRMNLIEKARRKFNRMKGSVKDNAQAIAQLYDETVGALLHRLYDSTGIDVFDDTANTVDEYVASSIAPYSLNYEGTETSKGVKQETGLSRSDFAKTGLLAKEGKGKTIGQLANDLWRDRPSNLENITDQDVRNAIIDLITSGQTAFGLKNHIQNLRIAEAENILEQQKRQADELAHAEKQKEEEQTSTELADDNIEESSNTEATPADAQEEDKLTDMPFEAPSPDEDAPFSAKDKAKDALEVWNNMTDEEKAAYIENNRVKDTRLVDDVVGKKLRKAIEKIAGMMGATIQWQRTDMIRNGWFNPNTKTVYLALDSSILEGVQFIFGHEMTHDIKSKSPAMYDELKKLVKEKYGEELFEAMTNDNEKRYADVGKSVEDRSYYEEETVADAIGDMINDLNLTHSIALKMSHPLLAKMHDVLLKIKNAFTGTPYSDNVNGIIRTIEMAYVKTVNREAVNTATQEGEGGQRLSLREKPAPKKTQKVYKLMRLGEDGKLYPLFIGSGADFTEFDFDHMGEGAGSQSFGWGGVNGIEKKKESFNFDFEKPKTQLEKDLEAIKTNDWNLPEEVRKKVEEKLDKYLVSKSGEVQQDIDVSPYFGKDNQTTAKNVLKYIIENSTDREIKNMAQYVLNNLGKNTDVPLKFFQNGKRKHSSKGTYYASTHSIKIDAKSLTGSNTKEALNRMEGTIIHEIAHAITSRAIDSDPAARKEILEIFSEFKKLRSQYGITLGYASKNPKEFVAEFLGNKAFREALMELPSSTKKVTLGQKILNFIKKILGIPVKNTFFNRTDDAILRLMDYANAREWDNTQSEDEEYSAGTIYGGAKEGDVNYVIFKPEDMHIVEHEKFSVKGGINRGYTQRENGDKISKNAYEAEEDGTYSHGTFKRKYKVAARTFPLLQLLGFITNTEWHHTGRNFSKTGFYTWADSDRISGGSISYADGKIQSGSIAAKYKENKQEIDDIVKGLPSKQWEFTKPESTEPLTYEAWLSRKIPFREEDYLSKEEQAEKQSNHERISADKSTPSYYRGESHKAVDQLYYNVAREHYQKELEDNRQQHEAEYKQYESELPSKMQKLKEQNLGTNGKEKDLMRIYDLLGYKDSYGQVIKEISRPLATEDIDRVIGDGEKFSLRLQDAINETDTEPTEAQKKSGNYKKGHVKFGGYDYTIENPKGSYRSGVDENGKEWKQKMNDTYGYIRGKFGKDGDHLDMFINDNADLDSWNGDVYVVDQVNQDGTFDEHKVMYGYDSLEEAKKAYLSNYEKGWTGLGNITPVSKADFDKWLDKSNRKLKPFADYADITSKTNMDTAPSSFEEFLEHPAVEEKASLKDAEYLEAVRSGDMEKAQKMVYDAARAAGYVNGTEYQGEGSWNAPSASVEKKDFANLDALRESVEEYSGDTNVYGIINGVTTNDDDFYYNPGKAGFRDAAASETSSVLRRLRYDKADANTKVKVYRAVPTDVKGNNLMSGDWIALSKQYCIEHGNGRYGEGGYRIIEEEVPIKTIWNDGNDMREFGFDDGNNNEAEKNVPNNRKLLDAVTYDNNGNVIPLSERFNESNDDIRYSLRVDRYRDELNQWKKDNNLPKDAERPQLPVREPNESAADFLKRVKEYRKQAALWATAPTYEDHLLTSDTAQGQFNLEMQRKAVLTRIVIQDSMLAIRKAQEAIMKEKGVDKLNPAEDAYTAENRSHGKAKNEFEEYNDEFLQPLRKAYNELMQRLGKSYGNVKVYMIAKHGLERNAYIAFKYALDEDYETNEERMNAYNNYKADMDRLNNDADFEAGRIDFAAWKQRDGFIRTKYAPSYFKFRFDENGMTKDYSGLSALFDADDYEGAAADLVKEVEDANPYYTDELWYATNDATKKILRDSYNAGMMTEDNFNFVSGMYRNYIPLRGWGDTNADQVWNYVGGGKGAFNQVVKEAKGRKSLADDPIAYIENMAESAILMNNRNWVKQHLLLLAQNHRTSLLNVSKAWYIKTKDAQGNEEWIPASPQITEGMTGRQVEAALEAFEQKMEQMQQNGEATQKREHLEISYPQTNGEEREHEVRVMKGGEEYVIYVNGDPQLAQAVNNTRARKVREGIEESRPQRILARTGRYMAAAYTSMSPLFIPSNYMRDLTMTLASTAIREDARYNYLLRRNMLRHWNTFPMVLSYQNGTLREKVRNGSASRVEQMFYDFMMNGGETGFVTSVDVEDLKKKFKNDLKDLNRMAANPKKVGHIIMNSIETLNRAIEDSNRFMVYMTSIEYGRSIDEAVNNAKDVTLNFNRKGTGEHGWQAVRDMYLFINPAVQSLQTLGALAKHHPFKFTAVTTGWLATGLLVPMLNNLLMSFFGGDDDKDKYWQFTKWDRRNNFIMWIPFTKEFVKIPLAQEFRGFYGVGDMIASKLWGGEKAEESWSDYAWDLAGQIVDMLPLDPTGYDGNIGLALTPNAARPIGELALNVDFTGKPIFKNSEYNKYDPNFTKAYVGTPDWLVRISKMVNSIDNKYPDVEQNAIDRFGDPKFNPNNPAVIDHLLSSYLGGSYTTGSQIIGVATKALNGDDIKMADIPLASKFVSNPDDRPVSKKQGEEFWDMKERHDRAANTLSKLKKKAKIDGDYSTLDIFFGSDEYRQYKEDDKKVKKYEEDRKKEKAQETGEAYRPHKTTADDVYKSHTTPKDDFEDMKMKQLYEKLNSYKIRYEAIDGISGERGDAYYKANKAAIDAIEEIAYDKSQIASIKKGFLSDGQNTYDADGMKDIRKLRKRILDVLEKANKAMMNNRK